MATIACLFPHSSFQAHPTQEILRHSSRKGDTVGAKLSETNAKRANLSGRRKGRVRLPKYVDDNSIYHIREFLCHPCGVEAVLNTRALHGFQPLDSNLYRCILPHIQLLNFKASPVVDLQVFPSSDGCAVEMLSYKFQGSDFVERQNNHFPGSMKNEIKWKTTDAGLLLDVDTRLDIVIEIYAQPFAMLPTAAVEGPGNIMVQAVLDHLVPLQLQQLVQDYEKWVVQQQPPQ